MSGAKPPFPSYAFMARTEESFTAKLRVFLFTSRIFTLQPTFQIFQTVNRKWKESSRGSCYDNRSDVVHYQHNMLRKCKGHAPHVHSLCSLSCDRSIASSIACSPNSAIWRFLFQFRVSSLFLRSFSSCLCLLLRLFVTSILPSFFPSIMCFRRQFRRKDVTNPNDFPSFNCF
jgi:hypothetical protein